MLCEVAFCRSLVSSRFSLLAFRHYPRVLSSLKLLPRLFPDRLRRELPHRTSTLRLETFPACLATETAHTKRASIATCLPNSATRPPRAAQKSRKPFSSFFTV